MYLCMQHICIYIYKENSHDKLITSWTSSHFITQLVPSTSTQSMHAALSPSFPHYFLLPSLQGFAPTKFINKSNPKPTTISYLGFIYFYLTSSLYLVVLLLDVDKTTINNLKKKNTYSSKLF